MSRFLAVFVIALSSTAYVDAQESATVLSEGIGKNIESAVQRAAEAALTQVVGSFIDTETRIERRKEIRDGIKTQTKSITSKLSEYSQGSIERLDVLDVEEEGGLIRVTAKVTVRIEDFKHYIKETVLATKKIKKGLLAQLKVENKQSKNLTQLVVDKLLQPLIEFQVVSPKIVGDIRAVTDPELLYLMEPRSDEYVISYDVEVKLNPEYLLNAEKILQETAVMRHVYPGIPQIRDSVSARFVFASLFGASSERIQGRLPSWGGGYWFLASGSIPVAYSLPAQHVNICRDILNVLLEDRYPGSRRDSIGHRSDFNLIPSIQIALLSDNGKTLRTERLSDLERNYSSPLAGWYGSQYSIVIPRRESLAQVWEHEISSTLSSGWARAVLSLLKYQDINLGGRTSACEIVLYPSTAFTVISKVDKRIMEDATKLVLSYTKLIF